jgi:hypothetical protein
MICALYLTQSTQRYAEDTHREVIAEVNCERSILTVQLLDRVAVFFIDDSALNFQRRG